MEITGKIPPWPFPGPYMTQQLSSISLQELSSFVFWDSDAAGMAEPMNKTTRQRTEEKHQPHCVVPLQHIVRAARNGQANSRGKNHTWCLLYEKRLNVMYENAARKCCYLVPENGFIKDLGNKWKNRRILRKSARERTRDSVGHQWHEGTPSSHLACLRTLWQSEEGKTSAPTGTL